MALTLCKGRPADTSGRLQKEIDCYDLLDRLGLPTSWNGADFDAVLALMHRDKKARGNTLRFVGLEKIGKPFHLNDPDAQAVREAFERVRQQA